MVINQNRINMKKIPVSIVSFILSFSCFSQQFITKGRIEYERKTNQHAFMDENSIWDEMVKKNLPKFVTYYFDLNFNNNRSLFKAGRDVEVRQNKYWGVFAADNIISTDLINHISVTQKSVYSDVYLITDSLRKIQWKIMPEIRKIAGFDCRKAVGKVMDSIVVIAFYSDEITASGGPESFTGLPGMILGLAIPRMHTTWYATKLQLVEISDADLALPKKGKKFGGADFRKQLKDILKDSDDYTKRLQWQLML